MQTDISTDTTTTDETVTDPRALALASHLGVPAEDITEGYQDNEYEEGRASYLVLTDDEADEAARAAILESLWAFNTDFLSSYIEELGDVEAARAFDDMRGRLCESANALVKRMLDDRLDDCISDAIASDGRGHFLSGYDSDERKVFVNGSCWYVYRTN